MTVAHFPITDRLSWLELRARDLTASDLGAVAGFDPYRSPFDVWAVKTGLAAPVENAAMMLGRWCEPAMAAALRELHPEFEIDYPLGLYLRDPELRLGATPDATGRDRTTGETCCFEFKVISRDSFEARWQDGGAPLSYQVQTLCGAMLAGAGRGVLAALVLGWQQAELVVREIPRHAGAEQRIRELARDFWAAFDEGHAPQPDYERDAATIRQVFRPDPARPAPVDLSADNMLGALLDHREELQASIRSAEKECSAIDAEVVHKLDGAAAAILPGWKISHAMTHRAAHMVAEKDYPVLRISRTREMAA
jgi:predicted phage-related endonuclease